MRFWMLSSLAFAGTVAAMAAPACSNAITVTFPTGGSTSANGSPASSTHAAATVVASSTHSSTAAGTAGSGGAGGTITTGFGGSGGLGGLGGAGGVGGATSNPNVGIPCMTSADCGAGLQCFAETANDPVFGGGPANGYCSMPCVQSTDCPGFNTVCYLGNGTSTTGRCVLSCTLGPALMHINDPISADGKCNMRDDVACAPVDLTNTVFGCLPACGEDSQCPGRHCDPRTVVCVDTPAAGSPTGAACDPNAFPPACAGVCLTLASPDGGGVETMCSSECVLGGDVPYNSTPSCGGLTQGLCIYSQTGNGAGDVGYCAGACSTQDGCQVPAFWCWAISGLTGAPGGVPNGFCLGGTPCPNGASDCTLMLGSSCTQTLYGPFCLPPTSTIPLGSTAPDGGADAGDAGDGGDGG